MREPREDELDNDVGGGGGRSVGKRNWGWKAATWRSTEIKSNERSSTLQLVGGPIRSSTSCPDFTLTRAHRTKGREQGRSLTEDGQKDCPAKLELVMQCSEIYVTIATETTSKTLSKSAGARAGRSRKLMGIKPSLRGFCGGRGNSGGDESAATLHNMQEEKGQGSR